MSGIKRLLANNRIGLNIFALTLYVATVFLSFDRFCFETITTETPLIKLGELPFARMEFVAILFALTSVAGAGIGILAKKCKHAYSTVTTTLMGIVMLLLVIFDVDMLQILAPDMRISHVVMTLSRMLAIVVGITGILFGVTLAMAEIKKQDIRFVIAGIIAGATLSIIAVSDKQYTFVYSLVATVLLMTGICGDFCKPYQELTDCEKVTVSVQNKIVASADKFVSVLGMTISVLTLYGYVVTNLGYSVTSYIICIGITVLSYILTKHVKKTYSLYWVLCIIISVAAITMNIVAVFVNNLATVIIALAITGCAFGADCGQNDNCESKSCISLLTTSAMFIGSVIAYTIIHKMSDIITFSGNRVVYEVSSKLFIIVFATVLLKLAVQILSTVIEVKKKNDKEEKL